MSHTLLWTEEEKPDIAFEQNKTKQKTKPKNFVHPQEEMFYPLLAALLAVDGNFCWMESEMSNRWAL